MNIPTGGPVRQVPSLSGLVLSWMDVQPDLRDLRLGFNGVRLLWRDIAGPWKRSIQGRRGTACRVVTSRLEGHSTGTGDA
jgi:hypothetical protein